MANTASWYGSCGGGVHCSHGTLTLTNCTIAANLAVESGGGIYCNWDTDATITNCTILGNAARVTGGGIWCWNSCTLGITNCTFAGNSAGNGDALACDSHQNSYPSSFEVANCILWDGSGQIQNDDGSTIGITYSDVQGGWPGIGNIDADPLFADPNNGDYRLSVGSPCIDAGCNWAVPPDVADLDGDGDTEEITPLDLDGEGRFFDDPNTVDTGCGVPPIVDMGAYEFGDTGLQPCFGDFNGDRVVGLSDLATLLANYGESEVCQGDLDCDGDVDTSDLEALLAAYGSTCQ